jgi:nicotinate-nucleotide adenylyltransferase
MIERGPALVFGGTFDPPHRRHVEMARRAADELGARSILVIPAALNPQRSAALPAPASDRLELATLAFRDEPRARVLDLELRRSGPSYTIDTLRTLHEQGEAPLRLLIGSDQALNFPTWKSWREVVALAPPAIVLRPPHDRANFAALARERFGGDAPAWIDRVLPLEPVELSATALREALARGVSATALDGLAPDVARAIDQRLLYRGR